MRLTPAEEASQPTCPPIERVAADLRRLGKQRTGIATRSPVWFTAVQRAYDDRLRVASGQLGIEHRLDVGTVAGGRAVEDLVKLGAAAVLDCSTFLVLTFLP